MDLASAYREAGRDREALAEFERAGNLMSSLGRDDTERGATLYNNWALELDQGGRPLEAEKMYRRAIDISRDGSTEETVSPAKLHNYAIVLTELDRLPQAADYEDRAYSKALEAGDEAVIERSLLQRSRIYRAQHDLAHAESMLDQVEPKMRKSLPAGHYGFASITAERALIALEKHDPSTALQLMDESIAAIQASVNAGKGGGSLMPVRYSDRSEIDLALGRANDAEADASRAIAASHPDQNSSDVSCKLGRAYLLEARALAAEGKTEPARSAAAQALKQLQGSLGPDHPDTQSARRLAE
jgi:eukaryotic-like serine/threonine-protein kinase